MIGTASHSSQRQTVPPSLARSWMLRSPLGELDVAVCDALVLDLEDGLAASRKDEGREAAAAFLEHSSAWVRVNAFGTDEWALDLAMAAAAPHLAGVMLAVTESAAQVDATAERLGAEIPIVALIESAVGLERCSSIAAHPATFRLAFGTGDFRRDTGMSDSPLALSWPRSRLVVASAAAGIPAPIDGPTSGDRAAVLAAAQHAAEMGMTGKLVLNTEDVAAVDEGLSPTRAEIDQARVLLSRTPDDSADGSYAPALARAQRVIDRAAAFGLGER